MAVAPAPAAVVVASEAEGGREDAKRKNLDATKDAAETPEALLSRGARLAASGEYVAAERAYAQFLQSFPTHSRAPEAALYRADVLDRLGRADQAIAARQELARRWPDSPQAQAARGAAGPTGAPAHPARMRAAPTEKKAAESIDFDPAAR